MTCNHAESAPFSSAVRPVCAAAIDDIRSPAPILMCAGDWRNVSAARGRSAVRQLRAKDPQAASRMDSPQPASYHPRVEVIEVTGRPYSASLWPRYRYVIASVQIGLDLPREELDQRIDIRTKQMLEGGFIEEVERIRPIWERPPGGRWAISKSSITWTGCAIWMTRSETSHRRPNGSPASRWDGSGVTRASIGSMRSIRDWWITRWPLSTMPTRAITTRSMRRRTSIRNIIWATCSNGRAAVATGTPW